jgi:hypothetical protein
MSVLGDFKKLLFGAKAVASSAANKAVETGKEVGEDLVDKSSDFIEKAADTAGELYDKASDKAAELYHAAKDKVDDITESIWETAGKQSKAQEPAQTPPLPNDVDEFVASTILENKSEEPAEIPTEPEFKAEKDFFTTTSEKVKETAEEVSSKLQEKSAEFKEKLKDVAEDVGAKLAEKGSEAIDRAREVGGQLKGKFNSLVEKAQEEAEKDRLEKEAIKAAALQQEAEFKAKAADKSAGSTLGGMDSFFEKASRFADGDYHNTGGKKPTEDDPNVLELKPDPNFKKEKKEGKVPGMDDLDGDGDELIDDAIIDKD